MKRYLSLVFLLAFWLINASSILGCVCDTSVTFAEEFKESDVVFSGRFVGAEYRKGIVSEPAEMTFSLGDKRKNSEVLVLKFQVEQSWKGAQKRKIFLLTSQVKFSDGSSMISDCDLSFEKGNHYLVYAYGKENRLQTSACSRTARLEKAKKDLKSLGKGEKPAA